MDYAHNVFEIQFTIDKKAPIITLNSPEKYNIEFGSEYIEKGYNAYDEIDKDLSQNITQSYKY